MNKFKLKFKKEKKILSKDFLIINLRNAGMLIDLKR